MTPILRRILFAYCLAICVKGQAPVMAPASVPVLSPDVVPVMAPAPLEMPLAPAPSLFPDQIAPAPTVPELIPVPPEEIERLRVTVVEILNFTGRDSQNQQAPKLQMDLIAKVLSLSLMSAAGGYITVCDSSRVLVSCYIYAIVHRSCPPLVNNHPRPPAAHNRKMPPKPFLIHLLQGTNFLQAVIRCDAAQAEVLASGTNFTTCPAACADANAIVGSQCVAAVNTALVQLLASKSGRGFQLSNFSLGASEICGMGLTYQGLAVPYEAGVTQFWLSQVNVSGVPACNATTLMARGASNFMSLKGQCNVDIAAGTAAGSCPDTCTQAITMVSPSFYCPLFHVHIVNLGNKCVCRRRLNV